MERPLTERRGIFALEATSWEDHNLENPLTIAPLLAALRADCAPFVRVIHRTVLTPEEVAHYLGLWSQRDRRSHAVLFFALHGSPATLHLPRMGRARKADLSLDWIEKRIAGRCHNRFVHFGSCRGLAVSPSRIRQFLRTTGACGISGFTRRVAWLDSGLFEVAFLRLLMTYSFDGRGMRGVRSAIRRDMGQSARRLGFMLHSNEISTGC